MSSIVGHGLMDVVIEAIRSEIHGALTGAGPTTVHCDVTDTHGPFRPIDTSQPVQFEVIRPVDVPNLEIMGSIPDTWVLELLRCPDCERTELDETTEGYEEALVEIGLSDSGYGLTIDATDLRLLDYSPVTEGLPQPVLPVEAVANALQQDDRGIFRVSRLQLLVDGLKTEGEYELAEKYELFLDATMNFAERQ